MNRNKSLWQDVSAYTAEDLKVWNTLFVRQMDYLRYYASYLYLDAIRDVGFNKNEIPNFEKVSKTLMSATGWQLTTVPELVPQEEFFTLLARRVFPATCWLRSFAELDYIEEPDMFHDVFGHVPLLINSAYANFMESFGKLALKWMHMPEAISLLGRIYWYTIEFGMIREQSIKIFGAGIVSSIGEAKHSMSVAPIRHSFDLPLMLQTDYRTDVLQNRYFVLDSLDQLANAHTTIESLLSQALKISAVKA